MAEDSEMTNQSSSGNAKEVSSRDKAMEEFRKKAREYITQAELDPEKVAYWEGKTREIFDTYGKDFDSFIEGQEGLVKKGDEVIEEIEATGFNISFVLKKDDFPIESEDVLIFYNCSIDRPEHFGLLLAEMEKEKLISEEQIKLSQKASEMIVGEWSNINVPENVKVLARKDGSKIEIGRTIETIVIFSPSNEDKALKIINFLLAKVHTETDKSIPGSWDNPDIRVSQGFEKLDIYEKIVAKGDLVNVVSNTLIVEKGKLVVLRKSARFDEDKVKHKEGWRSLSTGVNKDLAKYLVGFGIGG